MDQNDIPNTLAPKLDFRPTIDIVRDFDCALYLLGGILDYDDYPIDTTIASDGNLEHLLAYHIPTAAGSIQWVPGTDIKPYEPPRNIDQLYKNLATFNKVRAFCKENLEIELEKLRKEAEATVEYLASKNRFYEAGALVNFMVMSPNSYTTKAIEAQNADRANLGSPHLGALAENEKNCGQLFHYVKSATTPSASRPLVYRSMLQRNDLQNAEKILQKFIEKYLRGTLVQTEGRSKSYTSTVYHKIDPIEHRTCFWGVRNVQIFLQGFDLAAIRSKRNLFGETGLCVAGKHGLDSLELCIPGYHGADATDEVTTDARGSDITLTLVLAGCWNGTVSDVLRRAGDTRAGAFFSHAEVPGLQKIQEAFPDLCPNNWSYLDSYQLATLMGRLDFLEQMEAVAPNASASTYAKHDATKDGSVYNCLKGALPELPLGEYHPVILSALAGYTEITRYHLEKISNLDLFPVNARCGQLGALFLIAFKKDDLGLLDLLQEAAPFLELSNDERIALSRQAAELAMPSVFHIWMNSAWPDLAGTRVRKGLRIRRYRMRKCVS
ncbi:hypothetical protein TWF718_011032 [Orbilia javanica]|uniref:Uncharacterized protein n=1 Tax=Orbilia javanica TaxID=47235 RepID=A0AAN8R9C8_9PEZI